MPTINKTRIRTIPRRMLPSEEARRERAKVYNSSRWQRLRTQHIEQYPLCAECLRKGVYTAGTDVHHIESYTVANPIERERLAFDPTNLETLCKQCHQLEHHGRR